MAPDQAAEVEYAWDPETAKDQAAPADQEWDLVLVTIGKGPCGSARHAHRHVMTSWLDK
jgi:hypothetical protein